MIFFLSTTVTIVIGLSAMYFYFFQRRLSARIQHKFYCGCLSNSSLKPAYIESIPESIFSSQYFVLYDQSSKSVPRYSLPFGETTDLLKKLVRRNMTALTYLPQALPFRFASRTTKDLKTFRSSYIASLDFNEGDTVCGAYRVKIRSRNKVEFEVCMRNMEYLDGRMVIGCWERGNEMVFGSEAVMWRRCDASRAIPFEKPLLRWMHELAAWWLVDSGVEYLTEIDN